MKRMKKFWALLLALAMTCSLAACGGSSDEEPATDDQTTEDTAAGLANWGGVTWQTIYYGYRGSGDYLDPGSYGGPWTPSN